MNFRAAAPAHGLFHDRREVGRPLEWPLQAPPDQARGDAARFTFLAEAAEKARQLILRLAVDEVGGRRSVPSPRHAHVEGAVAHQGKASFSLVELHRRHAQVQRDAIAGALAQDLGHGRERRRHQADGGAVGEVGEVGGPGRRGRIAVEGDDLSASQQ